MSQEANENSKLICNRFQARENIRYQVLIGWSFASVFFRPITKLKRGETRQTKSRLFEVLQLIGLENGAIFFV